MSIMPAARRRGRRAAHILLLLVACAAALSCGRKPQVAAPGRRGGVPLGQLPAGVDPVAYRLELSIVPGEERFAGRAQIAVKLSVPAEELWLHGRGLRVSSVRTELAGRAVTGKWAEVDPSGLVRVELDRELPAGQHVLTIDYDAPFDKQLAGLYRVKSGEDFYAFTQFEPVSARKAFPCFDEPRWKTPFDVTLTVPSAHSAIANTPEVGIEPAPARGFKRVRFATTKPLPTYLVAFAVGPFDVVAGTPIAPSPQRQTPVPLRGIAVRGQGGQLKHALEHTASFLLELEHYFGSGYPYEKLDILAVPDFAAGAMENVGAITFRERLLLIDPKTAPESQLRSYANVMAHELAHQWCGNLVTMPWWDDIWLNEAFATFMAARTVAVVEPAHRAELGQLASVLSVMDGDSRAAARRIRQPIESTHDITNAFDGITYQKGAGVLAMFERYLGVETFQKGVQAHIAAHVHATATGKELMAALGTAAGKDVSAAMGSFLDQPGVPLVKIEVQCAADGLSAQLQLAQSRYLPAGSSLDGKQLWQVPVCVRYQVGGLVDELCTLLTTAEGTLPLDGGACPSWVMPNAEGVGYYRFTLSPADLEKLRKNGLAKLSPREKLSLADSLRAGFANGSFDAQAVLSMLPALAQDENRAVAAMPIELLRWSREYLLDEATRPALDKLARELYGARLKKLGWKERPREHGDLKILRADLASFFALSLRDKATRAELGKLGRKLHGLDGKKPDPGAVAMDVRSLALLVAVQDGDAVQWDALRTAFDAATDPIERDRLLSALTSVVDDRSQKALALSLDPALRVNEVLVPIARQLGDERTRVAAWLYLEQNLDAIVARISSDRAGSLPGYAWSFCSVEAADRLKAVFGTRIERYQGGPRNLAAAIEGLHLCAAQVALQRAPVAAYFAGRK
jgi:alanyl aminopeptidase